MSAPTESSGLQAYRGLLEAAREQADRDFADLWLSEDHREAEAAFAEKRTPSFKGK